MYYYYDFQSNNDDDNDDIMEMKTGRTLWQWWIDSKNDDDNETCQFSFCHNLIFSLLEFCFVFFHLDRCCCASHNYMVASGESSTRLLN